MAGYTKADFSAAYNMAAIHPELRYVFNNFRHPDLFDGTPINLRLHYHPKAVRRVIPQVGQRLINFFEAAGTPFTGEDVVVIIGGAYGWLGDYLEDMFPGLEYAVVDPSDYVHASKASSPNDDLIECIEREGYEITSGKGKYLYDIFKQDEPRARKPHRVMNEDLTTPTSLARVRGSLPRDVTKVVSEECWQLLSDTERNQYRAAIRGWKAAEAHIINRLIA